MLDEVNRAEEIKKDIIDLINKEKIDYKIPLLLLLLKFISDKYTIDYQNAYEEALEDGLTEDEAREEAKAPMWYDLNIEEEFLWDNLRKDVANVGENFSNALKDISEKNDQLSGIENSVNLIAFLSESKNIDVLRRLIETVSDLDTITSNEVLPKIFEDIIINYSLKEAKKGGIYTPKEIISLLLHILKPQPLESIYDPSSSYGEFLVNTNHYLLQTHGKEGEKCPLFGEESKEEQFFLSKINLIINGVKDFNIERANSLVNPSFKEDSDFKKFDVGFSNPEWNQKDYDEKALKSGEFWKKRFNYGFTTKQSADWAWIQHMLASAKDDGRVGVVIDNGCLFRGGKERAIRERILENDLIECVILLPEKLFYSNSGSPGAIVIFKKNKPDERKNKILFVNASNDYEQHPEAKRLNILNEGNIEKIKGSYNGFEDIDGFSKAVPLDEIKENDYNLNVTLYVFTEEVMEDIDVKNELEELETLNNEINELNKKIPEIKAIYEGD